MFVFRKIKIILWIVFLCTSSCVQCKQPWSWSSIFTSTKNYLKELLPQKKRPVVVVFVHGTLLPIAPLLSIYPSIQTAFARELSQGKSWRSFFSSIGSLKQSWYQAYLEELKENSLLNDRSYGQNGLHRINENSSLSAQIAADVFTQFYKAQDKKNQTFCHTFRWCGSLNQEKRLNAAHNLYQQLIAEIEQLKTNNISLVLVGHSHGGNVILNLAKAEEAFQQNLVIDKTVLLGTPVQIETQPLLESSIFKSVYHIYSSGDRIQKTDIISTKYPYSKRCFNVPHESVSASKLTQVELTVGDYQPGHSELWFWCENSDIVNLKRFSIFPLPWFVFLPNIIQQLETLLPRHHSVLVNVDKKGEDSDYTTTIYDKIIHQKKNGAELMVATLPKNFFATYAQAIEHNEGIFVEQKA